MSGTPRQSGLPLINKIDVMLIVGAIAWEVMEVDARRMPGARQDVDKIAHFVLQKDAGQDESASLNAGLIHADV